MMTNFIGLYDDVLSDEECYKLIEHYHSFKHVNGKCWIDGNLAVDTSVKKCVELPEGHFDNPKHKLIYDIIYNKLVNYTKKYLDEYPSLRYTRRWTIDGDYSFKKYKDESDGFHTWHTEAAFSNKRVLVWMFYLNDAESGTEFQYYPTVKAKRGRLIIWPAGWTHYHRSELNKGLKYILSGWYSFY